MADPAQRDPAAWNGTVGVPEPPVCPPDSQDARDTRALLHILLGLAVLWLARALGRAARRRRGRGIR